jgi:hypothetical protein
MKQKIECSMARRKLFQSNNIDRFIELLVEVVNPELPKISEHDVAWPILHRGQPVIESLLIRKVTLFTPFLHLDQQARLPN